MFTLFIQVDYKKHISVNLAISHPHYDKEGNSYNMGTSIADKGKTKYVIFKVPAVEHDKTQGTTWYLTFFSLLCTVYITRCPCKF